MKQTISLILALMTALTLSACGTESADRSNATVNRTYKLANAASSGSQSESSSQSEGTTTSRTVPLLYYPDSSGQYIISRELTSLSLSDQALDVKLVSALIDQGVLHQGVVLNNISFGLSDAKKAKDKKEVVLLDFSKDLQKQVSSCNANEERLLIGSVADTFLSAYGRELAQITVAGKKLVSPNEVSYTDPISWYDSCDLEPFTKTAHIDGTRLKLSLTRMYSDAGFLIDQDTDNFTYSYQSTTHTACFQAPDTRHQDETPATLTITASDLSQAATLQKARQTLGSGNIKESSVTIGTNQVSAACLTVTGNQGGKACYVFTDDKRVWLAKLTWNAGEEDTRLARLDYMLTTFLAVS